MIDATGYPLEPTPWTQHAACTGSNPNFWFPERGAATTAATARTICADCPVKNQCLDYALRWHIDHGIWGGHTPTERKNLHRHTPPLRRHPPLHGTTTRYHRGCRCQRCIEAQMAYLTNRP